MMKSKIGMAVLLLLMLAGCVSAETALPWQTGICPEACAVLSAPEEGAFKEDGPKAVLTPDMPVRVLGEEDGFVFIQYRLSETCVPFGYVPQDALTVKAPPLQYDSVRAYTLPADEDWPVTDDPLGEAVCDGRFISGVDMAALFEMDGWTYVEDVHSADSFRAFIPRENMAYGRYFELENWTEGAVFGTAVIDPDGLCTLDCTVNLEGMEDCARILLVSGSEYREILRADREEDGHFRGMGLWPEDAYGADLIFLDARGIQVGQMEGFAW